MVSHGFHTRPTFWSHVPERASPAAECSTESLRLPLHRPIAAAQVCFEGGRRAALVERRADVDAPAAIVGPDLERGDGLRA
jgi:hypothetical protein